MKISGFEFEVIKISKWNPEAKYVEKLKSEILKSGKTKF